MNEEIQHERLRESVSGHPARFSGLTVKTGPSKREMRLRKLRMTWVRKERRKMGMKP